MTGTPNQIEWAEQIKLRIAAEFDNVAATLLAASAGQSELDRIDTQTLIAILNEKRIDVLANDRAGYFIHEWQELNGQVRRMLVQDPRYRTINARRLERRCTA